MRILLLTPAPPYPPRSGGQIRTWEFLRYLTQRHELTLLYFTPPEAPAVPAPLAALCARAVAIPHPPDLMPEDLQIGRSAPGPIKWYGMAAMWRAVEANEPHTFDLVLVDLVYMTLYRDLLPPQTVLIEHNIESQIYKQYDAAMPDRVQTIESSIWSATWRMMELYENRVWSKFALRATVSEHDRREMERRCKTGKTIVIENGVNLQTHPLLPVQTDPVVAFVGTLDYFPNLDAAFYLTRTIMPLVWEAAPQARLFIAGKNPSEQLCRFADDRRVRVIADPEEMQPIIAEARVATVPLRVGSGTRLKILEAFTWGVPVVSTSIGCQGLDVTDGQHLLVRNDPAAFAAAIVELLSDPALYSTLRTNGRILVEQNYDWQMIFARFEEELQRFVNLFVPAK